MKKMCKILNVMFALILVANNALATTTGTLAVNEEKSNSTMMFMFIGILLICAVLFIGYKMDQAPANAPRQNKVKVPKKKKEKKIESVEINKETEFFDNENKNDIPYEEDSNYHYELDENVDVSNLSEEDEYEEDDISLFSANQDVESSFDDFEDEISFEDNVKKEDTTDDFSSTMIFDSNELNDEINKPNEVTEQDDDFEYTDAVEGLDEKINSLDDIEEVQDAETFMNELKKYEENTADNFEGFTTEKVLKEEVIEPEKKAPKRYTKKKESKEVPETVVEINPEVEAEMNKDFLLNIEDNMKKDQETRKKRTKKKKE